MEVKITMAEVEITMAEVEITTAAVKITTVVVTLVSVVAATTRATGTIRKTGAPLAVQAGTEIAGNENNQFIGSSL